MIGLVLQVPAMSSSGTTIKASATTNTAIAWLGDASGEMVDIHIPHTGNKYDVTVSTAIYVEDSYCCNDDFNYFFLLFLFLCFFSLFSPSPVSLPSLSPTHFQKVQACARAGMKLDNTISVHNLKYDGVHDNIHRLRWVPEHSGIGKSALSSRSLSTVYRQRIQSLSKSVHFYSFLFYSFLFFF